MNKKDYLWPGYAAIALAILYPLYWSHAITAGDFSLAAVVDGELRFTLADWVFLIVGALAVYIYLSIKRILNDHNNYDGIDMLLILMIVMTSANYGGLFLIDALSTLTLEQSGNGTLLSIALTISIASGFFFGILGILIGIVLLKDSIQLPNLVKAFAIATLVNGLAEISYIFAIVGLVVFPISLIFIAIYFLKKPEMIELV